MKKEADLVSRANKVEFHTARGAMHIEDARGSGLIAIDETKPDVVKAVELTGRTFQQRVLDNSRDAFNKSVELFAKRCQALFTQKGPDFQFSVLLLTEDPLHYSAKAVDPKTRDFKNNRKYFGVARPVFHQGAYTLEVQVIGARASEVMKDDIQGLSLASAVASRELVTQITAEGISGECEGEVIKGISDLNHLGKVLPVIDEVSAGHNRNILGGINNARGSRVNDIADLGHTHDLSVPAGMQLSKTLVNRSTTLNPLMGDLNGADRIVIDPQLTDNLTVIPMWDQLRGEVQFSPTEIVQAGVASVAVGMLSTFGKGGVDSLTEHIILPSNEGRSVPLSALRHVRRTT